MNGVIRLPEKEGVDNFGTIDDKYCHSMQAATIQFKKPFGVNNERDRRRKNLDGMKKIRIDLGS